MRATQWRFGAGRVRAAATDSFRPLRPSCTLRYESEGGDPANAGLQHARVFLEPIKEAHPVRRRDEAAPSLVPPSHDLDLSQR